MSIFKLLCSEIFQKLDFDSKKERSHSVGAKLAAQIFFYGILGIFLISYKGLIVIIELRLFLFQNLKSLLNPQRKCFLISIWCIWRCKYLVHLTLQIFGAFDAANIWCIWRCKYLVYLTRQIFGTFDAANIWCIWRAKYLVHLTRQIFGI